MSAAKWHRHWAAEMQRVLDKAQRGSQRRGAEIDWKQDAGAEEGRVAAAHHATAADALEALAVPGVAKALRLHAEALDDTGDEQVAAAMSRLAKIASEGK